MKTKGNELLDRVMKHVESAEQKLTPRDLKQAIIGKFGAGRGEAGAIIGKLVRQGRLEYIQEFGRTFIDISINRPVRLSNRIVVKPPGMDFNPGPDDIVLLMAAGASFGSGKHPTTRLALLGIEHVMAAVMNPDRSGPTRMLDLGTGSGILALAALKMGIDLAKGTDIDPVARFEARKNAELNGFTDRFEILDGIDIPTERRMDLITANLRYPTLKQIGPELARVMAPGGVAVFSGIRESEMPGLIGFYNGLDFTRELAITEKNWAGIVMIRKT